MGDAPPAAGGPWITWQDAQLMPEDGRRHEAIGGRVVGEIQMANVFERP